MTDKIQAFFNPQRDGDSFKGLNSTIEGRCSDRVIENLPEFLKLAGRDHYIQKSPAYDLSPVGAVDEAGNIVPGYVEIPDQFNLRRSTDHKVVSPKTVSGQYYPLSLLDIAEHVQPWVEQGFCTPDGVYDARGGSLELLSLRMNEADSGIDLPNGEHFKHYFLFELPHGTGGTAKGKIIDFRVVCANTFARAVSAGHDFSIRHKVSRDMTEAEKHAVMAERAKMAVEAWEQAKEHRRKLAERIQVWADVMMSESDAKGLAGKLFGIDKEEKASAQAKKKRDVIVSAFNMPNAGTQGRSAWDFLNAVTFAQSSVFSDIVKKSRTSGVDRLVRNTAVQGVGAAIEERAEALIAEFAGL